MWYTEAYRFQCPLSFKELELKLDGLGKWRWIERDSDTYGEYLMALTGDPGKLRIFQDGDRFVLDVRYDATGDDPEAAWIGYRQHLLDTVLPAVGATEIEQTDDYG